LAVLNSVGLYTEEQFEDVKEARLNDHLEDEYSPDVDCPSCDEKAVKFRVGFDCRLWGFFGTATGNWDTVYKNQYLGSSEARTGSWGADYMHVWYEFLLNDFAFGASADFMPSVVDSDHEELKDYGTHSQLVTNRESVIKYPSPLAYSPVNGGDKAILTVELRSIW